jgi:hypothetical protein
VRCDRAVTVFERGAPMARHACPLGEECHHLCTEPHVERLFDQPRGHGGVMAVDFDMVIDMDRACCHSAYADGWSGRGRSTGCSSASNSSGREPGNFLKDRAFRPGKSGWRDALTPASEKKVWCRSRASIQCSTTCTPTSTLALSRGLAARAGMTAKPQCGASAA